MSDKHTEDTDTTLDDLNNADGSADSNNAVSASENDEKTGTPATGNDGAAAANTADSTDATEGTNAAETADTIEPAPADSIQFSVVFDEDDEDDDESGTSGTTDSIYDSLGAAEESTDTADFDIAIAQDTEAEAPAADSQDSAESAEPSEAEADALASADASAEVTERNAARVNETLSLAQSDDKDDLSQHEDVHAKAEPTMTLASRIDRVLVGGGADDILLKTYPTFALNKVSLAGAKDKVNVLDNVEFACYAGHAYALLIADDPASGLTADAKRRALMSVMSGLVQPNSGTVMNKSANIAELEPVELRGHRLGIVPQLHAVQPDLDAEQNVLYAMNASNRNFLKPKPVIARELLAKVGFTEATSGAAVGKLPLAQQRLVAIARAISTEAEVLILDEPTRGLDTDDMVTVFAALAKLAHSGDPKHCVIVLTASRRIAEAADQMFEI